MKKLVKFTIVFFLAAGLSGCSDFLNPSTEQSKTVQSVDGLQDLESLIIGAHDQLSRLGLYGGRYIFYGEVRTANAFSTQRYRQFAMFNYLPSSDQLLSTWDAAYSIIANSNLIIDSGVQGGAKIQQVKGQAYALRALAHMIALELYGQQFVDGSNLGIPYVTDYIGDKKAFFPERLSVQATYDKIEADFEEALALMDPSITDPSTLITYYSALALQARYYMYTEEYAKAAAAAKEIIDSGVYSLVPANQYLQAWGTDGKPAFIFGIAYTPTDYIPIDGLMSLIRQPDVTKAVYGHIEATKELYELYEDSDVRQELYTIRGPNFLPKGRLKYRMSGKFPKATTNIPVIRYAEVVLTYAEAQFRLGNESLARQYLNKIPMHRNADPYPAPITIDDILLERRKELAFEGRYYFTLMRTEQDINRVSLQPQVSNNEVSVPYGKYRLAFPIPDDEINANPNIKQNKGY